MNKNIWAQGIADMLDLLKKAEFKNAEGEADESKNAESFLASLRAMRDYALADSDPEDTEEERWAKVEDNKFHNAAYNAAISYVALLMERCVSAENTIETTRRATNVQVLMLATALEEKEATQAVAVRLAELKVKDLYENIIRDKDAAFEQRRARLRETEAALAPVRAELKNTVLRRDALAQELMEARVSHKKAVAALKAKATKKKKKK